VRLGVGERNITASLFAAATVQQVFEAASSFVGCSVATEQHTAGDNLMRYVLSNLRGCVWS